MQDYNHRDYRLLASLMPKGGEEMKQVLYSIRNSNIYKLIAVGDAAFVKKVLRQVSSKMSTSKY